VQDGLVIRALLIDAMGTLLALEPPVEPLRAEFRSRFGIALTAAEAQAAMATEIAYYRANMGHGRDAASLAALRRDCARALRAALPRRFSVIDEPALTEALLAALRFRAFPDAAGALAAVRAAGVERVVVVSNWDASLPQVLERAGLGRCVDAVVTSAEVGAAKPSPAVFEAALREAGVVATQALHVGDSFAEDVVGARAAGVEAVLLDRGATGGRDGVEVITGLGQLASVLRTHG
jgi:putative hydrolase of the HAD superfamily